MKKFKRTVRIDATSQELEAILITCGFTKDRIFVSKNEYTKTYTNRDDFHDEMEYLEDKFNISYSVN